MPRIPFIDANFSPHDDRDLYDIEHHLRHFLIAYRGDEGVHDLSEADKKMIMRRSRRYIRWRTEKSGMAHLDLSERKRLEVLRDGVELKAIDSEHQADEIASALHSEMPWMGPATEKVWHDLRRSVKHGDPAPRLSPVLLLGPPGIGKSHWARRLGEELQVPSCVIDATGEPAGFSVSGNQRGWSSAGPGKPLETILTSRVANPVVVVDEVDKAGAVISSKGVPYQMTNALLPLLEPSTAVQWPCPFFRVKFDMSWITWVLTANSLEGLPDPFLSRCPPLKLSPLSRDHLLEFARREGQRRGLQDDAIDAVSEVIKTISEPHLVSLRSINRMLDNMASLIEHPATH